MKGCEGYSKYRLMKDEIAFVEKMIKKVEYGSSFDVSKLQFVEVGNEEMKK